jgi:universal stress protein E
MDIQRILVGLELARGGSELTVSSRKAAEQAIWIATQFGATLRLLHSTYDDELDREAAASGLSTTASRELSDAGHAALEAVVEEAAQQGIPAELSVTRERAWLEACRLAARGELDLVVVGKRNEVAEPDRRIGGVAAKLLREAPCPVWVVKPEHDLVHRVIMAASDLTPVGDEVTRIAAELARRTGCELQVVHAWKAPPAVDGAVDPADGEREARVESIRTRAQQHIRSVLEGSEPTIFLGTGSPAKVIREAVVHQGPDLLVIGMVSSGGVPGLQVGSTTERVLDRVECSILAIKPADFICPVLG